MQIILVETTEYHPTVVGAQSTAGLDCTVMWLIFWKLLLAIQSN